MKFEISQSEFVKLFGKVDKFVNDKKNQLCTLEAENDAITLATDNGTTTIKMKADEKSAETLNILEEGTVSVSTSLLFKAVKSLPKITDKKKGNFAYYPITFEQWGKDNGKLRLSVKKSFVDLIIVQKNCMPQTPEFKDAPEIKISKDYLFTAINQVAYATDSSTNSMPVLTGIELNFDNGTLSANGTDSHQLSQLVLDDAYKPTTFKQQILLSAKELKNIAASFSNVFSDNELITMKFEKSEDDENKGEVQLINDSAELTLRQIQGHYPALDKVVKSTDDATTVVTFNYWNLLDTVKHMSLMSSLDRNDRIFLNINADDQTVEFTSSSDLGKMKETVEVKSVQGDSIHITVSQSLFFQLLKTYPSSEDITFGFNGELRPLFVKTAPKEENSDEEYSNATDKASSVQLVAPIQTV